MSSEITCDQLPASEQARIESIVRNQLASLQASDRQIVQATRESFAYYVANAIRATAAALGYMIALPLAYVEMMAEQFVSGFSEGWNAAFDEIRKTRNI